MEGAIPLRSAVGDERLEARFAALVEAHRDRVVGLAWRLVGGDRAAAEDVAQDALVRAYRGLRQFQGDAKLETWLFRIVVRQAGSYRRWRSVRERFGRVDPEGAGAPDRASPGDPLLRERIGRALDGLSRGQRDAFVLVHLEGCTVRETAEILGRASGTVKSHLHRALVKLREDLGDIMDESERSGEPGAGDRIDARMAAGSGAGAGAEARPDEHGGSER